MTTPKQPGKGGLGKGLDVLFSDTKQTEVPAEEPQTVNTDSVLLIDVEKIKANPYQPREEFDETALNELADSIKQRGVIQAITVRRLEDRSYELITGERRLRASRKIGLEKIPAYVLDVTSKEDLLEIALIENIQRKDLNAIEVAQGYQRLIDECNLTQEQVSLKVGKSRAVVTNYLRMLRLPDEIKESIKKGELSEGHARSILAFENEVDQLLIWKRIIGESLSVRKSEEIVRSKRNPKEKKLFTITNQDKAAKDFLETKFREHFGTKVRIHPKSKTSGEIIIEYYTPEDLERIIELCKK